MVEVYRVPVADADRIRAGLALQLVAAATGISVEKMTAPVRLLSSHCGCCHDIWRVNGFELQFHRRRMVGFG